MLTHCCRPHWGWERDLPAPGGMAASSMGLPWSAMIPSGLAHLSPLPGPMHIPDPQPHAPHHTPSSLSPCRQPPLPLSCPSISCLSPPRLLPSLSLTSSPQLQGGTLSTSLQSRPSPLSRRSRTPHSRPPLPSPTAPLVRARGAAGADVGQAGHSDLAPAHCKRGSPRARWAVRGCLLVRPKLVPTCVPWARAAPQPRG